jgi:hypothetical protein
MRLSGQKTLGVGIYASTPRGRRQENPSSHDMGCRNFTQGKGKQGVLRVVDQLRRYSCSKKETSDASNHVLISMWKVAAHDWSTGKPTLQALQKRENTDKKRLNTCRKKQWRTFQVQGVEHKGRASLGLTTDVGSIFSAPKMGRRNKMSNSSGKTKIDSSSHCGEKRKSETSYRRRILRMKRKDC